MGMLDSKIGAVFADMNMPQRPGAALLVIDHDEIVYRKCYGLADVEAPTASYSRHIVLSRLDF
jgi:CubicO group peptidase (beta-lactamase class C family)